MKYLCLKCDYNSDNKSNYEKHLLTGKHRCCNKFLEQVAIQFTCIDCHYSTSRKSDYTKHLTTAKHKVFKSCKKTYANVAIRTQSPTNTIASLVPQDYNLMVELIKQNNELQKQIIEMSKETKETKIVTTNNSTNNSNNTNTTNNTTNQFNLNLFLNETCKNAINFSEFIDKIQVSNDDLENNAKMGFVCGMTKIIVDNLKQMALNDRPIHCTDIKRETIYVKEEDQWEKDNSKEVIQKGIQEVTRKNMCQLMEWRVENPEYDDMESDLSELSIGMQQNSMAGPKREEFYTKIVKNLAKESIIDKPTILKIGN